MWREGKAGGSESGKKCSKYYRVVEHTLTYIHKKIRNMIYVMCTVTTQTTPARPKE